MVNNILPDDEVKEAFDKIDQNIIGVEWEAETEIQDPATHIPQINNHQYAALADEEYNEDNENKSTGVDNDGKITEVRHNDKITGGGIDNKIAESGSTGSTDEAQELALIEEAIAEVERDISEATDLLAGTETENEEARNENMIHPTYRYQQWNTHTTCGKENTHGQTTQKDMDFRPQ